MLSFISIFDIINDKHIIQELLFAASSALNTFCFSNFPYSNSHSDFPAFHFSHDIIILIANTVNLEPLLAWRRVFLQQLRHPSAPLESLRHSSFAPMKSLATCMHWTRPRSWGGLKPLPIRKQQYENSTYEAFQENSIAIFYLCSRKNQWILHRTADFKELALSVCNVDSLIQLILYK